MFLVVRDRIDKVPSPLTERFLEKCQSPISTIYRTGFLMSRRNGGKVKLRTLKTSYVKYTLGLNSIKTKLFPRLIPKVKMICQKIVLIFLLLMFFKSRFKAHLEKNCLSPKVKINISNLV